MWMFYWIVSGGAGLKDSQCSFQFGRSLFGDSDKYMFETVKLIGSMEIAEYRAG